MNGIRETTTLALRGKAHDLYTLRRTRQGSPELLCSTPKNELEGFPTRQGYTHAPGSRSRKITSSYTQARKSRGKICHGYEGLNNVVIWAGDTGDYCHRLQVRKYENQCCDGVDADPQGDARGHGGSCAWYTWAEVAGRSSRWIAPATEKYGSWSSAPLAVLHGLQARQRLSISVTCDHLAGDHATDDRCHRRSSRGFTIPP